MNLNTLKRTAATAAIIASTILMPVAGQAANPTVTTSITTASGITVADGVDVAFGSWLVIVRNAESIVLTMDQTGAIVASGATQSTVVNLTPGTGVAGTVTVDVPVGANNAVLQMSRTAATAFGVAGLAFTSVAYSTAVEGNMQAFVVTPATEPVTVVTGGTPQTVTFSPVLTFSATVPDGTYTSSFDVSFAW